MSDTNRRNFMKLMAGGGTIGTLPLSIKKALATPANNTTRSIEDVEHVIFLMQENRSFDHYYGMLQGVRGFNDPRVASRNATQSVWEQPQGSSVVMPFHPTAPDLGLAFVADLAHDWESTHAAWNGGSWDGWIAAKTTTCMAHMERSDIPFHYALADAFTICDAYHCSLMGSTDPNRYYMWTGWVGNDGKGGGPVVDNAEAGYSWTTYPERLQAAGVTWKVYQDIGTGLTAAGSWGWTSNAYIGTYGDSSLLYFNQYRNADDSSPLAQYGRTGTNIAQSGTLFDILKSDVESGNLPQVSWIVAPEAYSEHPNWPPNYGAWYVSQVLDILTANPDVWSKTVVFLTFDENDGFFDHVIPPAPPPAAGRGKSTVSIENEIFPGTSSKSSGPYGFGPRVPMTVISPWTRGGWVNSQVFDHTSMIRFLEKRFGSLSPNLTEPNITPWRRVVSGDLTSIFNFQTPNEDLASLPSTTGYVPPDQNRHSSYVPSVPTTQTVPQQESGVRPARALPYDLHTQFTPSSSTGMATLKFVNSGEAGAVFHVRDLTGAFLPRYFTVEAAKSLSDTWIVNSGSSYNLETHGPNGFFRAYRGTLGGAAHSSALAISTQSNRTARMLIIELINEGASALTLTFRDAYASTQMKPVVLAAHGSHPLVVSARSTSGWYDVTITAAEDSTFRVQIAGHLENGQPSITDPLMGGVTV